MRKSIIVCVILTWSFGARAQFRNEVYSNWDGGYAVGAFGRYQASTNAITSNLLWNTYQGKFLSRSLREKVSNLHGKSNRVGADLDYGIFAKHIPDSTKGIGWFIKVADRTHINANYPKALFDLASFGNAMFAGETIDLAPTELNLLMYTQYEVGILKNVIKPKGKWNIGFGVSLLTGKRNLQLKIDQAQLYTDPDGEFIDGEIHGSLRSSSLSSAQYFDANGIGFSASVNIGYGTEKFGIRFEADDLGIIRWSKNLKQTDLDTIFRFEGIDLNLFPSDGGSIISANLDSIVNGLATKKSASSYNTTVPGRMRIEGHYMINSTKQWRVYAGVQYRIAPGYIPYAFIGTDSKLGKGFYIDGRFAYGGFGSWNLGLELRKRFAEVVEVRIGTNNLEGYVLPMIGTSQSAYISIIGFF
ncbi:MAG: DUF5723 family protein [Flavobacteriales bacterium]|nr:DUF5723 family protein [Flavobacteriales bacterium]